MPSAPRSRQPQFTTQAESDLDDIEDYISQDNPQASRRLLQRLREVCFTLAEQPYMGYARPEFGPFHRSFVVPGTQYIIFYRPTDAGVEIIHVRHGSQNLLRFLEQ
ncbi:MAG: type II toxin-antitoxin system RelE/ParE family toxin [Chloroflexi bacterium]|nr:type II toxin-antitoxin system RelE/ParE family toxin [Chloroflexota bacterium]